MECRRVGGDCWRQPGDLESRWERIAHATNRHGACRVAGHLSPWRGPRTCFGEAGSISGHGRQYAPGAGRTCLVPVLRGKAVCFGRRQSHGLGSERRGTRRGDRWPIASMLSSCWQKPRVVRPGRTRSIWRLRESWVARKRVGRWHRCTGKTPGNRLVRDRTGGGSAL